MVSFETIRWSYYPLIIHIDKDLKDFFADTFNTSRLRQEKSSLRAKFTEAFVRERPQRFFLLAAAA